MIVPTGCTTASIVEKRAQYAHITEVHDKECDLKIISCPNDECTEAIQPKDMHEHVESCQYTVIPCKYEIVGCGVKMKRRDLPAHEDDNKLHLRMAMDATIQLKKDVVDLKGALQCALIAQKGYAGTFKLTDFMERRNNNMIFFSQPFYTHPRGYHMLLKVFANGAHACKGTHVTVSIPLVKGNYDAELHWPIDFDVTFTLLNQLADNNHHSERLAFRNAKILQDLAS